eukprot:gene18613-20490_t
MGYNACKPLHFLLVSTQNTNSLDAKCCLIEINLTSQEMDNGKHFSVDDSSKKQNWVVPTSECSRNTVNPIRRIFDKLKIEPNPNYEFISLSVGDPTIFGNLNPPEEVTEAISKSLKSGKNNGYGPSTGTIAARKAVADYISIPEAPLTEKDIVLTSGCSHALELCFDALADKGDNILVPKPGFSIYTTLAKSRLLDVRQYELKPENNWEINMEHLESLIDAKTRFIVINNPSNPCGSVFSKDHLLKILQVAEKHRLPIIADEIYAYFVFSGETFYPIASLTKTVPVLSVGAISKRFLVPGWRLGWIAIHDCNDALYNVRQGLFDLATKIVGPNSIVQGALTDILTKTPQSFFNKTVKYIEDNATVCYETLSQVPGLTPIKPQGAMYMMVGLNDALVKHVKDDLNFTEKLVSEKSVFCLPGSCFAAPKYFRIVLTAPEEMKAEMLGECRLKAANKNDQYTNPEASWLF